MTSIFRYNLLILIVTYVLPLVTLTVTYARVGFELWGSRAIGENTPVQYERIRSKRRVSHVATDRPQIVNPIITTTIPQKKQKHLSNLCLE